MPKSTFKLFFFFLSNYKLKVLSLVLLIAVYGIIPSIDSILLKNITDVIENVNDEDLSNLMQQMIRWIIIYGVWWETINLIGRAYDYVYLKTLPNIKAKVYDELYAHIQKHSHSFFQHNLAGNISNRITDASRSMEMIFSTVNEKIIHKASMILAALITIYTIHKILALIFFSWVIIFVSLSLFFAKNINRYSTIYGGTKAVVAGKIVDSILNISVIRMFAARKFERKYLSTYINDAKKSDQNMQWFMFKLRYALGSTCSIMIFIMIYSLVVLRSQALINIGDCVLVLSLCVSIMNHMWDLNQEIGDAFEEIGAFNQTLLLILPDIIVDSRNASELKAVQGEIKFREVTFFHGQEIPLFKNVSVTIPSKQKIGLVGYSGSGKTTFVNLITRLHEITRGQILIDGQDIKNITLDSLRNNISIIPQEPTLFHRSIIDNIRYGKRDASDKEVIEAAKHAHIHEMIMELPDGYNTLCGERGGKLSGGQRQRVVIARAILKDAPILILDEATSALDSATENNIQESIQYLMQDKTVLVIAHKLQTLLDMDRILVFDKGKIIGDGKHEELLTSCLLYKNLWRYQIKGIIAEVP